MKPVYRMMRVALSMGLLLSARLPGHAVLGQQPALDSARLIADVSALAADSMEGRRVGTAGGARARAYLMRAFARVGLVPEGDAFRLPFHARTSSGSGIDGVNLAGTVRGTRHPGRFVVVSAHYDHLGIRGKEIFHGADDNASGTAGVLALARWFKDHPPENSMMFVLFDAEESGNVGSNAFVGDPPVPLAQIVANVNLDMVGRNARGELYAAGASTSPVLKPLLDSTAAVSRVKLLLGHDTGTGSANWVHQSDQGAFADKGIPFAYFGVEDHADYHRPTDTVDRIEPGFYYRSVQAVGDFVARLDRNLDRVAAGRVRAPEALEQRIQEIMDRSAFKHSTWGIEFYDADAKHTVFSINRDRLFVPGSTTKLVTIGTALELLGREHRFHTGAYRTGPIKGNTIDGDLVLVARGDPNLSGRLRADGTLAYSNIDHSYGGLPLDADPLAAFRALASQIAAKGIRRVTGRLIVDASLFPEGERELGTGVPISPMVLNDNVVDIVVSPGATTGDKARVVDSPRTSYLTVRSFVTTADSGTLSDVRAVEDSTNRDARVLTLTGSVSRGSVPVNARWAVALPSRFAELAFARALHEAGVEASVRVADTAVDFARLASHYADSTLVAEHTSAPFSEEAKVTLKMSQNLHASMMPMVVASTLTRGDTTKTGFDLEREWLGKAGLDLNGAVQGDGAGGDAYFSPAFMTRFLEYSLSRPWAEDLRRALPVLGRDGTLALIQPQSPAAGHVFAKTGTFASYDPLNRRLLLHAKGLAGYFTSKSGKSITFAIYLNNFALDKGDPTPFAGQALGEIAAIAWEFIP